MLLQIAAHFRGNERESFAEVMNMLFVPGQTTWTQLAGVCDRAGFIDLTEALLNSYSTGERQHSNYLTVFIYICVMIVELQTL